MNSRKLIALGIAALFAAAGCSSSSTPSAASSAAGGASASAATSASSGASASTGVSASASASGSTAGGGAASGKVALLLPESHTARYEAADRPFFTNKFNSICSGVQLLYSNANEDTNTQQTQAQAAINNGATVLVLDPVDGTAVGGIMSAAKAKNVKVISYDRLITAKNTNPDWYISFDNEKVGELQGQTLLTKLNSMNLGHKPNVVWINGSPKDNNATLFKQGAHKVLDGQVNIVLEQPMPNWQTSEAQAIMNTAITQKTAKGYDGVYVANDGGAAGVYAAEKAHGIDPASKPMTGQDAQVDAIQRILAGTQYMTVYKAVQPEAEAAAELACNAVKGDSSVPSDLSAKQSKVNNGTADINSILLQPIAVTADGSNGTSTVANTVVKDKYYGPNTVQQICTGSFAADCTKFGIK